MERRPRRVTGNRYRNLACPLYTRCLDHAVARSWPGWSCKKCRYRHIKGAEKRISSLTGFFYGAFSIRRSTGDFEIGRRNSPVKVNEGPRGVKTVADELGILMLFEDLFS